MTEPPSGLERSRKRRMGSLPSDPDSS